MADSPGPPVVSLCVESVEMTHTERQIGLRRFEEEMIMVVHQTVPMTQPVVALDHAGENRKPVRSVTIIGDDGLSFPRPVTW
ncbi:hypothetical protein W02_35780 [Nitrospira sp. KM1]|nr:hypothetical protein W02_35780 [Nitrospira sp. KM1]